jgi:N-acetylated-alpha-linked acidic dipeptidase
VLQVARGLGRMVRAGWRPERTIVLVGWDGEEYGLLGSTEWVEQKRAALRRNAVGYINMDGVSGRNFGASAVPALDQLIKDVSRTVPDPGVRGTVFDNWAQQSEDAQPQVGRLGSGSD